MMDFDTPEDEIAWLRSKLDDVRSEKDEALELVSDMRESLQTSRDNIDVWIEVFDMQKNESGMWCFDGQRGLFEDHKELFAEYKKLIAQWNKFVPAYNAQIDPKGIGRPLDASDAQVKAVKAHRKAGVSLRGIAEKTGLSLRTVRTITDKDAGKGRTAKTKEKLRRKEYGRARAAAFRARKRQLDALPKQIDQLTKTQEALIKAAKGLSRA